MPAPGPMLGLRAWARAARPGGRGVGRGASVPPLPRGGERAPPPLGALGVLAAAAGPSGALLEAARRAVADARAAAGELRAHGGGGERAGGGAGGDRRARWALLRPVPVCGRAPPHPERPRPAARRC